MKLAPPVVNGRALAWKFRHDERSRNYSIPTYTTMRGYRFWNEGPLLDQGETSACVGFGWTNELLNEPVVTGKPTFDFAQAIYHLALKYDDIAGEDDTTGTSVLAGAKAAQKLGFISEYRWCFSIDEVARGLYNHGPVVIGIPWLNSMFEPKYLPGAPGTSVGGHESESRQVPDYPVLDCSGDEVGGHCALLTGFTRFGSKEYFRLRCAWGEWGLNGSAMIRKADLGRLLHGTGEACIAFDRPQGGTLTPDPMLGMRVG